MLGLYGFSNNKGEKYEKTVNFVSFNRNAGFRG